MTTTRPRSSRPPFATPHATPPSNQTRSSTPIEAATADSTGRRNTPSWRCVVGREPGWGAEATGRPPMRSPGRPPVARKEHLRLFWAAIARGATSADAGIEAGVSQPVGTRWFRDCGGVALRSIFQVDSGRYLSFDEREQIALWRAEKVGVREIARRLGRSASTVSRELRRNASTRGGVLTYRATVAQWHRDRRAARPKTAKLAANPRLRGYVQERLSGQLVTDTGVMVAGPPVPFTGRNRCRRADRRWARAWSPEPGADRGTVTAGLPR